jgi:hypothetical protein
MGSYAFFIFFVAVAISFTQAVSPPFEGSTACSVLSSCEECTSMRDLGCLWFKSWGNYENTSINEGCRFERDVDTSLKEYKIYKYGCPCVNYSESFEAETLNEEYILTFYPNSTMSGFDNSRYYDLTKSFLLDDLAISSVSTLKLTREIPSGLSHVELSFYSMIILQVGSIEGECPDAAQFYILDHSDSSVLSDHVISKGNLKTITSELGNVFEGEQGWCELPEVPSWEKVFVDLSAYAGMTIDIVWQVSSNNDEISQVGWNIDLVQITTDCPIDIQCINITSCDECLYPEYSIDSSVQSIFESLDCRWFQKWGSNSTASCGVYNAEAVVELPIIQYSDHCPCTNAVEDFETQLIDSLYMSVLNLGEVNLTSGVYEKHDFSGFYLFLEESELPSATTFTIFDVYVPNEINALLCFDSYMCMENAVSSCYDGGFINVTVDGVNYDDIASLLSHPYYGPIEFEYGNPFGNVSAWCDFDVVVCALQQPKKICVNLAPFTDKNINITWSLGTDNGGTEYGWSIDNIKIIYDCVPEVAEIALESQNSTTISPSSNVETSSEQKQDRVVLWSIIISAFFLVCICLMVFLSGSYRTTRRRNY